MKTCSTCGNTFECAAQTSQPCWCMQVGPATNLPASDCLCRECLLKFADYYIDANGMTVFTEAYHMKRGTCCNSGCRHCPF